jgi:uncharacterized protein (UPF0335 family)
MTIPAGSNTAPIALVGFVDRYEGLLNEQEALGEDLKAKYGELKSKNLPVAEIKAVIAQTLKDEKKLTEKRQNLTDAGQLLGVPVYTTEAVYDATDDFADDTKLFARQAASAIVKLGEEIKALGDDMKAVLKEAKGEGFIPKFIPRIVKVRRDPDAYREESLTFTTYLNAVGVAP